MIGFSSTLSGGLGQEGKILLLFASTSGGCCQKDMLLVRAYLSGGLAKKARCRVVRSCCLTSPPHQVFPPVLLRGFALLPPAPPRQLACFQESSFQDLGGSLRRGSGGFEGTIIRTLLGSDALGSLILCILRGSEALRRSIIT